MKFRVLDKMNKIFRIKRVQIPVFILSVLFILSNSLAAHDTPTPSASPLPSAVPTPSPTPSLTPTPTVTPSPVESPSPTPTPSPSPTASAGVMLSFDDPNTSGVTMYTLWERQANSYVWLVSIKAPSTRFYVTDLLPGPHVFVANCFNGAGPSEMSNEVTYNP
jgi:hypothetical protein